MLANLSKSIHFDYEDNECDSPYEVVQLGSDELMQASPELSNRDGLPKQPTYDDLDKELLGSQHEEFDRSVSFPHTVSPQKQE